MDNYQYLIDSQLFFDPVDITKEMNALASQENHDEREHDLLILSADYIEKLREEIHSLNRQLGNEK